MCRLFGILTVAMVAYSASAFTIDADFSSAAGISRNLYTNCPSTGSGIFVEVSDCKECGYCVLEKEKNHTIIANFTSPSDVVGLSFRYKVFYLFDIQVASGEEDEPDVILTAGQEYTYSNWFVFPNDPTIPNGKYKLSLDMVNMKDQSILACIDMCEVEVVNPKAAR